MGCGSCGTSKNGKPAGCKSNGGCSTGGCNRLNVFDWLNELPLHDGAKPFPIIEVSFSKGSRKEFFRNTTHHILEKGDFITVEGVSGIDIGTVSLTGELVKLQLKKYNVTENSVTKRVMHHSTEEELQMSNTHKAKEPEMLIRSRAIAKTLKLDMKLCEVEVQADGRKATFFYTADQRVDFRELIKYFANDFKLKVEMKQIGARQESAKVGGIGSCGRELCCSTWLSDFKSVNVTAARYQNLSINQTKLSGQCGRLKCCLNFELDTYMDALSVFPDHADHLETLKGVAHLQKRDIFRNLMWYSFSDNNKQYPLAITRVKEIIKLNKMGQKVEDLQPVELEVKLDKHAEPTNMGYVNDVGQITLKNLEKSNRKKKPSGKGPGNGPREGNREGGREQNREGNPNRPQNQPRPPRPPRPAPAEGEAATAPTNREGGNKPPRPPRPQHQNRPQQAAQNGSGEANGGESQSNQPRPPRPQQQNRPQQAPQNASGEANGGEPQSNQPRPQQPNRPQGNRPQGNRPNHRNNGKPKPQGPQPNAGAAPNAPTE